MSSTTDAHCHAQRLIDALTHDIRDALRTEPLRTLEEVGFTLRYRTVEARNACGLSGSFQPGPPPLITLSSVDNPAHIRFTALHEYGHALVQADTEIHDVFFARPDGGRLFEEDVCHAVASRLLIPDTVLDGIVGPAGPTAADVAHLIAAAPQASAAACCVRAGGRLHASGHVMLARNGTAVFTAAHGTNYRVRAGSPQGADHLVTQASVRGHARGPSHVVFASGARSDPYQGDAIRMDDGLVVAVFTAAKAPWISGYQPPATERHGGDDAFYPHCDSDFAGFGAPCKACGGFTHNGNDGCGQCACNPTRIPEQTCRNCFYRLAVSNFRPRSRVCKTCEDD